MWFLSVLPKIFRRNIRIVKNILFSNDNIRQHRVITNNSVARADSFIVNIEKKWGKGTSVYPYMGDRNNYLTLFTPKRFAIVRRFIWYIWCISRDSMVHFWKKFLITMELKAKKNIKNESQVEVIICNYSIGINKYCHQRIENFNNNCVSLIQD